MDPAWFRWLVLAVQRVPHIHCGPHDAHLSTRPFHFTSSNHGHFTAVVPRYGTCPTMTCLGDPSRATQWRSKPVHTMEIQAGSHNGDPKTVHTMQIQAGSHNGDPTRFTQWRSKPVHTMEIQAMEIQSRFTQWRFQPVHTMAVQGGPHNGDPKPVHTMEIQAGSHNGDPSRFTQWRSKLAHKTSVGIPSKLYGLCLLSSFIFNGRLTFSRVGLLCGALFLWSASIYRCSTRAG